MEHHRNYLTSHRYGFSFPVRSPMPRYSREGHDMIPGVTGDRRMAQR